MKNLSFVFLMASLISLMSCSSNDKKKDNPVASNFSDAEIANILTTVNRSEIEKAEIIVKKGKHKDVKNHALEMIQDHQANDRKTKEIMLEADMDFDDDTFKSQSITAMAEVDKKKLSIKQGENADKEYLEAQIKTHKTVLKELQDTLIPQAGNTNLKYHLEATAKTIREHLKHAQALERELI